MNTVGIHATSDIAAINPTATQAIEPHHGNSALFSSSFVRVAIIQTILIWIAIIQPLIFAIVRNPYSTSIANASRIVLANPNSISQEVPTNAKISGDVNNSMLCLCFIALLVTKTNILMRSNPPEVSIIASKRRPAKAATSAFFDNTSSSIPRLFI